MLTRNRYGRARPVPATADRLNQLVAYLKDHPDLTVRDLSGALQMSVSTVTWLLAHGHLFRRTSKMPPYTYRAR
jgi:hypothetical protein